MLAALIAAAVIAFGATQSGVAALTEACKPSPKTSSSFCVKGDLKLSAPSGALKPGVPVNTDAKLDNSSPQLPNNKNVWLQRVRIRLGAGRLIPVITPSRRLPNELAIARSPSCTRPDFTDCKAGHGTILADIDGTPFGAGDGLRRGTFGIRRIVNVKRAGRGNLARYRADVSACVRVGSNSCFGGAKSASLEAVIRKPDEGDPPKLNLAARRQVDVSGGGTADVSVDSLVAHLKGRSSKLGDGSSAGGRYTIVALPRRCGTLKGSSELRSADARVVKISRSFRVRCPSGR